MLAPAYQDVGDHGTAVDAGRYKLDTCLFRCSIEMMVISWTDPEETARPARRAVNAREWRAAETRSGTTGEPVFGNKYGFFLSRLSNIGYRAVCM